MFHIGEEENMTVFFREYPKSLKRLGLSSRDPINVRTPRTVLLHLEFPLLKRIQHNAIHNTDLDNRGQPEIYLNGMKSENLAVSLAFLRLMRHDTQRHRCFFLDLGN
jgi:hypothetical protein